MIEGAGLFGEKRDCGWIVFWGENISSPGVCKKDMELSE